MQYNKHEKQCFITRWNTENDAKRRIFDELQGVSSRDETPLLMLDILLNKYSLHRGFRSSDDDPSTNTKPVSTHKNKNANKQTTTATKLPWSFCATLFLWFLIRPCAPMLRENSLGLIVLRTRKVFFIKILIPTLVYFARATSWRYRRSETLLFHPGEISSISSR